MKLKLGEVYITGGPKNQKTVTLPFWNEDSRGEGYRYVHISLKADTTEAESIALLKKAIQDIGELKNKTWVDGKGWI